MNGKKRRFESAHLHKKGPIVIDRTFFMEINFTIFLRYPHSKSFEIFFWGGIPELFLGRLCCWLFSLKTRDLIELTVSDHTAVTIEGCTEFN